MLFEFVCEFVSEVLPGLGELPLGGFDGGEYGGFWLGFGGLFVEPLFVGALVVGVM